MIFWSIAVIFIFLQAAGLPIDGVTWLALWALLTRPTKNGWVTVVILAWLLEIVQGNIWSGLALIYLGLGLGLWWYRRKYYPFHPVFLGLFFAGGSWLVSWLTGSQMGWVQAGLAAITAVLLRGRMIESHTGEGLRLEYK